MPTWGSDLESLGGVVDFLASQLDCLDRRHGGTMMYLSYDRTLRGTGGGGIQPPRSEP